MLRIAHGLGQAAADEGCLAACQALNADQSCYDACWQATAELPSDKSRAEIPREPPPKAPPKRGAKAPPKTAPLLDWKVALAGGAALILVLTALKKG